MASKPLLTLIGGAALILDPFFGCESETEFHYGETEMRTAIEGTWKIVAPAHDAVPARTFTISIKQGDGHPHHAERSHLVRDAAACAERMLVRGAGACMDFTMMPLAIDGTQDAATRGELMVFGTTFTVGELRLSIGKTRVNAHVSPRGETSDVEVEYQPNGSMVRIASR